MYKVVKVVLGAVANLQAKANSLKAFAIKRQENRIALAAERTDREVELAEKRVVQARALAELLEDRAIAKLSDGIDKANADKLAAGKEIDKLKAL